MARFVAAAVVLIGAFVWVPAVRSTAAEGSRRSTQADRPATVVYYGDSLTSARRRVDGSIPVRAPDDRHFCPVADPEVYPCPVYSSGGVRFGVALADAAIAHAGSR
ncbi:MAG: hypothetical protein WEA75_04760 [Acidimicrobiia bacterium]